MLSLRATGGELFDYLAEKDALTEDEAAKFTRHILEGIDCMHEKNIVHLDLKARQENVMFIVIGFTTHWFSPRTSC